MIATPTIPQLIRQPAIRDREAGHGHSLFGDSAVGSVPAGFADSLSGQRPDTLKWRA